MSTNDKAPLVFVEDTRWVWWKPRCMKCNKPVDKIVSYKKSEGYHTWTFECHGKNQSVILSDKIYDTADKIAVIRVFCDRH